MLAEDGRQVAAPGAALTPVYAEPNRERSEAHKMAEGHARNEAEVWLRHDKLVNF